LIDDGRDRARLELCVIIRHRHEIQVQSRAAPELHAFIHSTAGAEQVQGHVAGSARVADGLHGGERRLLARGRDLPHARFVAQQHGRAVRPVSRDGHCVERGGVSGLGLSYLFGPKQQRLVARHDEAHPQHARGALGRACWPKQGSPCGTGGRDLNQCLGLGAARRHQREARLAGQARTGGAEATHQYQVEVGSHVAEAAGCARQAGRVYRSNQQGATGTRSFRPGGQRHVAVTPDVRTDHVAHFGKTMRGERPGADGVGLPGLGARRGAREPSQLIRGPTRASATEAGHRQAHEQAQQAASHRGSLPRPTIATASHRCCRLAA
jgi:hypothetical protein